MKAKELQELEQWKVGAKVVVKFPNGSESISTIERITDGRGGTIYLPLPFTTSFNIYGNERTSNSWHFYFIQPATEKDINRVRLLTYSHD